MTLREEDARWRTVLFVPAHQARFLQKALTVDADVVVLDLEDGVAPRSKEVARRNIAEFLSAHPGSNGVSRIFVRTNAVGSDDFSADIEAALRRGLDGLVVPKVRDTADVEELERCVLGADEAVSPRAGRIELLIAIESARALLRSYELATTSRRVAGLVLGAEDLSLDLGLPVAREADGRELLLARSWLVIAARAAGVAVIDGVFTDVRDPVGLEAETHRARSLGFDGKAVIHPDQVPTVHSALRPTPSEIDAARSIIAEFDRSLRNGDGAASSGGRLVDLPIVERARRTLRLAGVG